MKKAVKMALALLIIIVLTAILVYATFPYINYLLGAFILYIVFGPIYHFFVKKVRLQKQFAAVLVIIISVFFVLVPLYFLLNIIISEIQQLLLNQAFIIASIKSGGQYFIHSASLKSYDQFFTHYISLLGIPTNTLQMKIREKVIDIGSQALNYTSAFILGSIQSLSQLAIGLLIMYFLFYYLLIEEDSSFRNEIYEAVPFNEENTAILLDEFKKVVRTTIVSSGAVALVQGGILTITFLIFKIQGAFLWGSIATILAFVPVFGSSLVWVPATIIQFLLGNYAAGVAILFTGLLASVVDSFLRPIIQKKVGEIHPIISLFGIAIGVSLFGLIGIVIGPLLLSYFILTVKMFSIEYLS